MKVDEAIERLNAFTSQRQAALRTKPLQTTEVPRAFFKNPPSRDDSPSPDELTATIIRAFRAADEIARRKIVSRLCALAIDAAKTFGEVAALTTQDQLRIEMRRFPGRRPEERTPGAFLLREEVTADGFHYAQVVPWLKPVESDN